MCDIDTLRRAVILKCIFANACKRSTMHSNIICPIKLDAAK